MTPLLICFEIMARGEFRGTALCDGVGRVGCFGESVAAAGHRCLEGVEEVRLYGGGAGVGGGQDVFLQTDALLPCCGLDRGTLVWIGETEIHRFRLRHGTDGIAGTTPRAGASRKEVEMSLLVPTRGRLVEGR